MNIETFLRSELALKLKREGSNWLTECPVCGGKLSVCNDTSRFRCFSCYFKGNAFTLMSKMTPFNPDAIWAKLKEYGIDSGQCPEKPKPIKPPIDARNLRFATDDEIRRLAESKKLSPIAMKKLNVMIDRKNPEIAVLPMCRRNALNPVGGIRVRLDGKPCWYVGPEGEVSKEPKEGYKPVKYPMIKDSLVGILGAKWLKSTEYHTIILCEGFKDMVAAIQCGYTATTFGGCGNWTDDCLTYFQRKHVYILFDCDKAGQNHAMKRAHDLRLATQDVYLVPPWTTVKDKDGDDLYDTLITGT